jgi:Transcription elongation factor, GreA/GreB, C-term
MAGVDKRPLVQALVASIAREIEILGRAANSAREAATHEENKPENDKDTRAVEAAYLAGAQADRVRELERAVNALGFLPLRAFGPGDAIAASAVIDVEAAGKRARYFLAPVGGGLKAELEGTAVLVITPQSPMGRALLGKEEGDVVEVTVEGGRREVEILAVH